MLTRTHIVIALTLIVLLGAGIRLWGVNHTIHTDENKVVKPSILLAHGEQKPLLFPHSLYPHLYHYFLGIAFLPLTLFDTNDSYATDYYTIYMLVSRIITALVGTATIILVYAIGSSLVNKRVGLLAALLFAVIPLHVKYSHYTHVDMPLTFMAALTFLVGSMLWKQGTTRWYILTGIAVGLSAATHYPGFSFGIILLIAHGHHVLRAPNKLRHLFRPAFLIALVLIPLTFTLASPYFVLDWREGLKTYQGLNNRALAGDLGYTRTNMLWPIYTQSPDWGIPFTKTGLMWEITPLLFILAVSGTILAAVRKRWDIVWLCGGTALVLYLSITGYVRMTAVKRLLPILPLLAVVAAYALISLTQDWRPLFRRAIIAVVSLLIVIPSLWQVLGFDWAYSHGSTHTEAVAWARQNLPEGSTILQHTPLMFLPWNDPAFKTIRLNEVYANVTPSNPEVRHDRARDISVWINKEQVDYVVLDSRIVDRYYEPTSISLYPETTASYQQFFNDIRTRGTLVYSAKPALWSIAGPRIEIYNVQDINSDNNPV